MKKGGRRTSRTGAEAKRPRRIGVCPTILALLQGVLNFEPTSTTFSYNSTILALLWGVNTSESCIVKETQHFCCKVEEVGPRKILTKVNNVREFFIAVLLY